MKTVIYISIFLLAVVTAGFSQDYTQTQNTIKAIYTYNFLKDIDWPSYKADGELTLCLMLKNSFFDEFEKKVANKSVNGRAIKLTYIPTLSECNVCDMIFIDEELASKKNVRTESCQSFIITNGFFDKGLSNIALVYQDKKLQFGINKILCDKLGYKVASRLSTLANQTITASK